MYRNRLFSFLAIGLFLVSCSTTQDKWLNRKYHETTAHYNAYFNGEEAFNEAVRAFESTEVLDFEQPLPFYYWPTEKQATALFSKMDRALEKGAKVIKGHSMVFSGKQKNEYVVKAYLLIAKSRFYKHEYIQTLEACSYIQDQFGGMEMARDEVFWSKLLAAHTHLKMGNAFSAEALLDESYTRKLPKELLHAAQKAYAYYYYEVGDLEECQGWIESAIESSVEKDEKVRLSYINAQVYALRGLGYESAMAYESVLDLHPNNYDITFSAQIKRAENFDVYMEDIAVIEKELRKMLRDDKNISYRDQIYYVWALKELDLEHYPEGENLLRKSVSSSINNPKQKGKSYLRLANVDFLFQEFVSAKSMYDSALAVLPPGYPGLDTLQERTEVLDELVVHYNEVALQDSLQALYGRSEAELREKFEDFIEEKKRREAEAARLAEINALKAARNAELADAGPIAGGSGGKWYFYNPTVRSQGLSAFKRTWGDRALEDHWRQKEKPVDGFGEVDLAAAQTDTTKEAKKLLPTNPNSVEYYMARVLQNDDDLKSSLRKEASALAELGFVYLDGLHDYRSAVKTWDRYLGEFTSAQPTAKVWYGRYLLFDRTNDTEKQVFAKEQLLEKYGDSPYAKLVGGAKSGPKVPLDEQQAYDRAFAAYLGNDIDASNRYLKSFVTTYPESALLPKAALLQAYILGLSAGQEEVVDQLKSVISEHKNTEEATRAGQILALLMDAEPSEKDVVGSGAQKVRKINFDNQPNAPHKVVFALPAENTKINDMRNTLADFNKENFKFDNLRIQNIFYDQNTQLVIISGLRSEAKAKVYLNTFETQGDRVKQFYPLGQSEVFYINNPNFGKVYRDKVLKDYIQYFKDL